MPSLSASSAYSNRELLRRPIAHQLGRWIGLMPGSFSRSVLFFPTASGVASLSACGAARTELLWRGCMVVAASGSTGATCSYLATAAALPLRDQFLAEIDLARGFDWQLFLSWKNSQPIAALLLVDAGIVCCSSRRPSRRCADGLVIRLQHAELNKI
jgi:hypothetical protein